MDAQTESTDTYLKMVEWLHAHRKPLLAGISTIVVIGLVWGFVAWSKAQHETDANADLFSASVEGGPRSLAASPGTLLNIAQQYPGTAGGEYAQLLAASALFSEGKYPEAQQQFSTFIDDHTESPLVPQAKIGVAACLEAEGKIPEAISRYHDLIVNYPSDINIVSPAKLTLARLYEQDNKPDQAFNYYAELARLLAQNPYDPWGSEARERAQILVAKHPEFLKSQAATGAQPGTESGFSVSGAPNETVTPASQPSKPSAPAGNETPKLLSVPNASSNSTGKP
jgi:predicted negative regulator of RcsB-dependent stress response